MGCTLSKASNNIGTETYTGRKTRQSGLRHWIGKKRQALVRLVRPSHTTPPQSETCEEPPNDIFQKPQLRRRGRKESPETLDQNSAGKRGTQRRHVKHVLSSCQDDISNDDQSHRRRLGKGFVKKQSRRQQVDDKHQEEVSSDDVSQLHHTEEDPDDGTPSVCQLDMTLRSERLAGLRRKAQYKKEQKAKIADMEEGWDSEEEQRAFLEGDEWQEKRKRIEEWVEDGIREMKAKELRQMMKKLKGAVRQKQDEVEGGMKMDLKEQSAYLDEMVTKQEKVLEGVFEETGTGEQLRKEEDEESVSQLAKKNTGGPRRFLELKERLKEEEGQRDEIKKAASAKMEKYFAARLEMRMRAVSERVRAEEERKKEKVLERCRQRRMEEKRREEEKKEEEMETKKKSEMHARAEAEPKSNLRVSFDFQDSVDELTGRKVKMTGGLDSRQKDSEKVKRRRGHADPMEELDVAINEILAKDDSKPNVRRTPFRPKQTAVPKNTPTNMHGIAPSVASRYQGGVHFQATSSSSHTAVDRECPPTAQLNQMTSQRKRLTRPNAAYGDRPYPPTTGRIPDSAWEFFQRQRKN